MLFQAPDTHAAVFEGYVSGFTPEGEPVSFKVLYRNPSLSWVWKKLEEDATLLCRTHGFRRAKDGERASEVSEGNCSGHILLLHPELDAISFLFGVTETEG